MESKIADHEAKGDVPPYPDTKVTLAFGNDTFPVLVKKLASDSVEVLQAALRASCRLLPTALNAVKAVSAGAIPAFANLCTHPDTLVRQRATKALEISFRNANAKRAFVDGGLHEGFKAPLCDSDLEVRRNAANALVELVSAAPWSDALQAAGYVPLLVDRAQADADAEVQSILLRLLCRVVVNGSPGQREAVASADATVACVRLLKSEDARIREGAAAVLAQLAFLPEGKTLAVANAAAPALAVCMGADPVADVRAAAASAAMSIIVDNTGKQAFLDLGLEALAGLIGDRHRMVRLTGMRAVAAMAAHPEGRLQLKELGAVDMLKARVSETGGAGLEHDVAFKALQAVTWVP